MTLSLKVCGAARTVTGSCMLFQCGDVKFLVDCGMYQGPKSVQALNYQVFPFNPSELDFVLLTHAHIDHSGLLPKLAKHGFKGSVFSTQGTYDLCTILLPDSSHIQQMESEELNRRNKQRGREEVTPAYTSKDVEAILQTFKTVEYEEWIKPAAGVRARFWNAGHILGSASIEMELTDKTNGGKTVRFLVSGDLGSEAKLLQPNPEAPNDFDYVVCESTYGGTVRQRVTTEERLQKLSKEIKEAAGRKGALLIPAFAVERTQELLHDILVLMKRGEIPSAPIFMDSPLAIKATEIFLNHADELDNGVDLHQIAHAPNLKYMQSAEESKSIERFTGFHIIVSASGMCDAGRIRFHLRRWLWNEKGTVLLAGFQAMGTLGRLLQDGAKAVRIKGEEIRVRATIRKLHDYSGHADRAEILRWLGERRPIKRGLFLLHGEEEAMTALAASIPGDIARPEIVHRPSLDDVYDLSNGGPKLIESSIHRRVEPDVMTRLDWHNDMSRLLLDISEKVDRTAGDKARAVLIRKLRRALEETE